MANDIIPTPEWAPVPGWDDNTRNSGLEMNKQGQALANRVEWANNKLPSPIDFQAKGDGVALDDAAFIALEAKHKNQVVDLLGLTYLTSKNFSANQYVNGTLVYSSVAVPGDAPLVNPNNRGLVNSTRLSTVQETKSGLRIATIDGVIQGAVLDHYSNVLYVLSNSSGTPEGLDELNLVKAYKWNGQSAALVATSSGLPTNTIGHQSLGIQVLESGTRSTAGDVRLWSIAGVDKGAEKSRYATRFKYQPGAEVSNVEHFKLWGDDVNTGTRTLGTDPQSRVLVMTSVKGSLWTVRVFDMQEFNDGPGDYSKRYAVEFKIRQFNRSLQDVTTDGEFIYLLHGGTAFSSTFKYLDVYSLTGTHISTTKIQAGALRSWEISEGGGDLLYEPEAIFLGRGLYGYELLFANTNGTPVGASQRETTIYTLRPCQSLHLKPSDSTIPALISDAAYDVVVPLGQTYRIGEVQANGDLVTMLDINRSGQSQSNTSGGLTIDYSSTGETQVRVTNANRSGMIQVSSGGSLGFWDRTNSKWVLYSTLGGNLAIPLNASATPGGNGEMMFERTSDTQLKIKLKGQDGVVRAATLTLS